MVATEETIQEEEINISPVLFWNHRWTQMNADKGDDEMQHRGQDLEHLKEMTHRIIGCAYAVGNELGVGFLEKVYENALAHELRKAGLNAEQQKEIKVEYDGVVVGDYMADLVVNNSVIVELKVAKAFDDIHMAQCLNYLKATGMRLCLLINFGTPRVEIKRIAN